MMSPRMREDDSGARCAIAHPKSAVVPDLSQAQSRLSQSQLSS